LQERLFLFGYESVTNTEKPQVLRGVFMRSKKNYTSVDEKETVRNQRLFCGIEYRA
jgi:hypothetical protein